MRTSTYGSYLNGIEAIQRLQQALDFTQRQISSGRRILRPSDDPIGSARAIEIDESVARLAQFDRNATIARSRLSQEEVALSSVNDLLQRVRELALQGMNGTHSNESRQLIAIEVREHLDNLVQIANQQDGNGTYLFAGNLEETQPVARNGTTFSYNGDQGQRLVQIGEARQVAGNDPGSAVFFAIRNGNGTISTTADAGNSGTGVVGASDVTDTTAWDGGDYTVQFIDSANYEVLDSGGAVVSTGGFQPGDSIAFQGVRFTLDGTPQAGDRFTVTPSRNQDIFATVENLALALEQTVSDDVSRAAQLNALNANLSAVDQALGNVLDIRTTVGSRLSAIDAQTDNNGGTALALQQSLSEIQDLDYAEAISRLSVGATTLEAAQRSFVQTQRLSLFNYI